MKQTVEEAKSKKEKAEKEIASILEKLEMETGLKAGVCYLYRVKEVSKLAIDCIERVKADITLTL